MSVFEDIDKVLHPIRLEGLRQDTPPVSCTVWLTDGGTETFDLNVYPFDTLDTIKQLVAHRYKSSGMTYMPKFTFAGIPQGEGSATLYVPFDYLWLPPGTSRDMEAIKLPDPRVAASTGIPLFTTEDGNLPPFSRSPRGRTTIEDAFLIPRKGVAPSLHIIPLSVLFRLYKGAQPISSREWNRRFAPYFPNVSAKDPLVTTPEDAAFAKTVYEYVDHRERHLDTLSDYLEDAAIQLPALAVTGIQQLRLILQKRKGEWEGCDTLFYKTPVTKMRPYLRLIPASGTPVTKVLVRGVLPIPALEDPDVLFQWAKEAPPKETEEHDFLIVKYVHRPSIGTTCPIYGTIYIYEDGTANLLLQTPKNVKKLEPSHDFRKFRELLTETLKGFPQTPSDFKLREVALTFQIQVDAGSKPFDRKRILERIPFFSSFFQVMKGEGATDSQAMVSLRYKAVSQYATEPVLFSFLTQTALTLEEEGEQVEELARRLQKEFQLTLKEARNTIDQWRERQGVYTLVVPEENEFMTSYNPGINIHIFQQHPFYYFHVKRVDSYQNFRRIYSLLSLLFLDEDDYFETSAASETRFKQQAAVLERESLEREEGAIAQSVVAVAEQPGPVKTVVTASAAAGPRFFGEEEDEEGEDEDEGGEGREATATAATAAATTTLAKAAPALKEPVRALGETRFKGSIDPAGWFLDRLKSHDPSLFQYKPIRKGGLTYSSFCAANEDRQPAVLTPIKYQRMRDEYAKEENRGELFFNVFPIEGDKDPKVPFGAKGKALEITIMRYGSNPFDQHYYFCPELYCLFDEIMVLETDFKSLKTRDGKPKPPNSCPFCFGGLITDKHSAMEGNTVFRRAVKPKSDKKHLYIGFTKTTTQPDGYALPCCHVKHKLLAITDDQYRHIRQVVIDRDVATILPVREVVEEEEEEEGLGVAEGVAEAEEAEEAEGERKEEPVTAVKASAESKAIPYPYLFERVYHPTTYIVSAEKHPLLTPGKFAIVPAPFDKYFQQNSSNFIQRAEIRQVLKEEGQGFLRIGTEIGEMEASCGKVAQPTEALLGVLAPLLDLMSIDQVRKRLLDICKPKLFAMANFGNLVNEFYRPTDPDPWHKVDAGNVTDRTRPPPISDALRQWARDNLQIQVTSNNQTAIKRIHNAHIRFVEFMNDRSQRKELRHLTSFLAEPGLLTESGLQLIVLEWTPPKAREEVEAHVTVRCSPYGFSMDRHRQSDFAFVWRDAQGYYELFVHTQSEAKRGAVLETHNTTVRWSSFNRRDWPVTVRNRVNEYMSQCQSNYRSLYTLQRGVDTMAMVPLSVAVKTIEGAVGVVRDSYNHAVLVLYPSPFEGQVVSLPVVDDGWIPIHLQMILDLYDFEPAPIDVIQTYYKEHFASLMGMYPGYMIQGVATGLDPTVGADTVVAAVLKNGLYIRAAEPRQGLDLESLGLGDPVHVEDFEWNTNRFLTELDAPCSTTIDIEEGRDTKELDELYQQYRYIVSRWFDSDDAGPDVRRRLEAVLFSKLPTYEKRKRMEVQFGSTFRGWLSPDDSKWDLPKGFLRKDCRVIDKEGQCTGSCKWKSETGTCGLHVDATVKMGSKGRVVSTADMFARRIMDELIQFPMRRKQLMTQEVGGLAELKDAIRDGDQYIIPERGSTWIELLRMDWSISTPEEPKFYEEMAGTIEKPEVAGVPLSPALSLLLGKEAAAHYRVWVIPSLGALTLYGVQAAATETRLDEGAMIEFTKRTKNSIATIDLTVDPAAIVVKRSDQGVQNRILVLIYTQTGLGVLMENTGDPYIEVDGLPQVLMYKWRLAAPPVIVRRKIGALNQIPPPPPPPAPLPAPAPLPSVAAIIAEGKEAVVPVLNAEEGAEGEVASSGETEASSAATSDESEASSAATSGETEASSAASDESEASSEASSIETVAASPEPAVTAPVQSIGVSSKKPSVSLVQPLVQPSAPLVQPLAQSSVKPSAPLVQPLAQSSVKPSAPLVQPLAQPLAPSVKPLASSVKPSAPLAQPLAPSVKPSVPLAQPLASSVKPPVKTIAPLSVSSLVVAPKEAKPLTVAQPLPPVQGTMENEASPESVEAPPPLVAPSAKPATLLAQPSAKPATLLAQPSAKPSAPSAKPVASSKPKPISKPQPKAIAEEDVSDLL